MADENCKISMILYVVYVNILYLWNVLLSSVNDTCHRIWKLKPVPYEDRKDFVAVVTGGGRGLGAHVVKNLLSCGMTVVVGVRNVEQCKELVEEVAKLSGRMDLMTLDVSNMESVRRFSEIVKKKYNKINILVNNAGIIYRDKEETEEGFEPILATNYLGHFLLTHLLLDRLIEAGKLCGTQSRIVNVSSCAHAVASIDMEDINMRKNYVRLGCYGRSKLALLMFSRYLDYQLKSSELPVISVAVHPGIVFSNMFGSLRDSWIPLTIIFLSEEEGARNVLFCCLDSGFKGGEFFYNDKESWSTEESKDLIKQKYLFEYTCKMLNISTFS